ncbi:MAG: helix-turn-helix domain-containing protein [Deltaproteobacteria bacterium]|jgi:transcriptional regulator with XRE-family HTH domain|nr:helix-turn-helix domain-containing protein [Deltaproteobacteria bacterium]
MKKVYLKDFKDLFEDRGYTAKSIGKMTQKSIKTVYKWINGETIPEAPVLCLLAEKLQTSVDTLLGRISFNKTSNINKVPPWIAPFLPDLEKIKNENDQEILIGIIKLFKNKHNK